MENQTLTLRPTELKNDYVDSVCRNEVRKLHAKIKDLSEQVLALQNELTHVSTDTTTPEPRQSKDQKELMIALAKAKEEIDGYVPKTGSGPRGPYAKIEDVLDAIEPIVKKYGLIIKQETDLIILGKDRVLDILKITVRHIESDQFSMSVAEIKPDFSKGTLTAMQSYGGSLTSTKRYVLGAIFGIVVSGGK